MDFKKFATGAGQSVGTFFNRAKQVVWYQLCFIGSYYLMSRIAVCVESVVIRYWQ